MAKKNSLWHSPRLLRTWRLSTLSSFLYFALCLWYCPVRGGREKNWALHADPGPDYDWVTISEDEGVYEELSSAELDAALFLKSEIREAKEKFKTPSTLECGSADYQQV